MKILEIINDLKRLNAYLPKDPQKNYANPLDRMARELWLIREFALQGDQTYVTTMLELNRPAPLPKTKRKRKFLRKILKDLLQTQARIGVDPNLERAIWKIQMRDPAFAAATYKKFGQDLKAAGLRIDAKISATIAPEHNPDSTHCQCHNPPVYSIFETSAKKRPSGKNGAIESTGKE